MSYSFHVRGATREDVLAALSAKFEETVREQPVHEKDRDAAEANAKAIIALMPEPSEGTDLVVNCNGYVTFDGELPKDPAELVPLGLNVSCYANYIASDLNADGSGKPLEQAS